MATKKQIEDAERVLQAVLDSVPHEDYEERALALLVNAALHGIAEKGTCTHYNRPCLGRYYSRHNMRTGPCPDYRPAGAEEREK